MFKSAQVPTELKELIERDIRDSTSDKDIKIVEASRVQYVTKTARKLENVFNVDMIKISWSNRAAYGFEERFAAAVKRSIVHTMKESSYVDVRMPSDPDFLWIIVTSYNLVVWQ